MIKKVATALMFASVATAAITSFPAVAHGYDGGDAYYPGSQDEGGGYNSYRYEQRDYQPHHYGEDVRYQNYRQQQAYLRYQQQRRAEYERQSRSGEYQSYYDRGTQGYAYRGAYPLQRSYYQGQRCKSGTTAAIIGAVAGGLLGREIGRGGRYDAPSTTGLILGAGGGALAGRAIGRSGNDC